MIAAWPPVHDVAGTPAHAAAFPRVSTLVVVIGAESARLVVVGGDGSRQDVLLEPRASSRRRRSDWAAVIDAIYQSHMAQDNPRHFDALAQAVAVLTEAGEAQTVVLAGASHLVADFRARVPRFVRERIAGTVPADLHEPAAALLAVPGEPWRAAASPGCRPAMTAVIPARRATP